MINTITGMMIGHWKYDQLYYDDNDYDYDYDDANVDVQNNHRDDDWALKKFHSMFKYKIINFLLIMTMIMMLIMIMMMSMIINFLYNMMTL